MLLAHAQLAAATGFLEIGTRTATPEKTARLPKPCECVLEGASGLGLINDLVVPDQSMCPQTRENAFNAPSYRARWVNIVDPELPSTETVSSV